MTDKGCPLGEHSAICVEIANMKDDIRVLRDENDQIRKWTLGLLVAILVAIIGTFFIQIREARVDGKVLASEIAAELRNDGRGTK